MITITDIVPLIWQSLIQWPSNRANGWILRQLDVSKEAITPQILRTFPKSNYILPKIILNCKVQNEFLKKRLINKLFSFLYINKIVVVILWIMWKTLSYFCWHTFFILNESFFYIHFYIIFPNRFLSKNHLFFLCINFYKVAKIILKIFLSKVIPIYPQNIFTND